MKLLSLLFPHPSPVEHLIPVRNAGFSPYSNSTGVHCGEGVGSSVGREGELCGEGGSGSRVGREGGRDLLAAGLVCKPQGHHMAIGTWP